jgi:hypothetical protein
LPVPQRFNNHTRWDPSFHLVLVPLALGTLIFCAYLAYGTQDKTHAALLLLSIAVLLAALKTRSNPIKLQDRLIRLEEHVRLHRLMPGETAITDALTPRQLVGLRFASDTEAPSIARRAVAENLTSKQIKEAIQDWRPDHLRV